MIILITNISKLYLSDLEKELKALNNSNYKILNADTFEQKYNDIKLYTNYYEKSLKAYIQGMFEDKSINYIVLDSKKLILNIKLMVDKIYYLKVDIDDISKRKSINLNGDILKKVSECNDFFINDSSYAFIYDKIYDSLDKTENISTILYINEDKFKSFYYRVQLDLYIKDLIDKCDVFNVDIECTRLKLKLIHNIVGSTDISKDNLIALFTV